MVMLSMLNRSEADSGISNRESTTVLRRLAALAVLAFMIESIRKYISVEQIGEICEGGLCSNDLRQTTAW